MTRNVYAVALVALLLGTLAFTAVRAQSSASFGLRWNVIGSGGENSQSNSFVVSGTVGQSVSSPPISGSASYQVTGGYWSGIVDMPASGRLYLPQLSK